MKFFLDESKNMGKKLQKNYKINIGINYIGVNYRHEPFEQFMNSQNFLNINDNSSRKTG